MQISSNSYPVARLPVVPASRREDARVVEAEPSVPVVSGASRQSTAANTLPTEMLQLAQRGRPGETGSSFSSQQALTQYADIVRREERRGQVEVLGIDVYA